jgi:hypothetical protein
MLGPPSDDEKLVLLERIATSLNRLRGDAKRAGCDFLAFLLASAEDEARTQCAAAAAEAYREEE